MLEQVNKSWNWKGFYAVLIISENDFGNIIFQSQDQAYWRLCPEELSCEIIAKSKEELNKLWLNTTFIEDWKMTNLKELAYKHLGKLTEGKKYCLKIPPILGGSYSEDNLGIISFNELIDFSGNIAFQIKDLKEGEKFELKIVNQT